MYCGKPHQAGAILYKPVYAGNERYPAIVTAELFCRVQDMKTPALYKRKERIKKTDTEERYELIQSREAHELRRRIEQQAAERLTELSVTRQLVLELAAELYSCIKTKEEE